MRRALNTAVAALAILATGGTCGYEVIWCQLDPSATPEQPVIDLGTDGTYAGEAKVSSVAVIGYDLARRWRPDEPVVYFWRLEPAPTWLVGRIDRLSYGTVPTGMVQQDSLIPIRTNHAYEAIFANRGNNWYAHCLFIVSEDSLGARSIRELTDQQFSDTVFDLGGR